MNVTRDEILVVCLVASVGLLVAAEAASQSRQDSPAADSVVATVADASVSRAELDAAAAPRLAQLEEQAHQVRLEVLEKIIETRLLAREASRRGVAVERLEAEEITAKVTAVSEGEVDSFVTANRERMPADLATVRPQVRRHLEQGRAAEVRDAFLARLKADAGVAVLLAAPTVYRADVSIADAPVRGAASAPVTVVEFADFDCPYCRAVEPTIRRLLATYGDRIQVAYRFFPLESLHPQARRLAEAGWCAAEQQQFWPFHERLQSGAPDDRSDAGLRRLAVLGGLDGEAFDACLSSGRAKAAVQAQIDDAARLGISGTPAFLVNGRLLTGALPYEMFATIVDEELARVRDRTVH